MLKQHQQKPTNTKFYFKLVILIPNSAVFKILNYFKTKIKLNNKNSYIKILSNYNTE